MAWIIVLVIKDEVTEQDVWAIYLVTESQVWELGHSAVGAEETDEEG